MHYHYSRKIHYPSTKSNGVLCNARSKVRKLDTTEYPDEGTCGNCIASLEAMKRRSLGPMLPFMPAPEADYRNVSGKVYVAQLSPVNVVFERKGFGPGSSKALYDDLRRKTDRFGRLKVVMTKQHLEELASGLRVPALFLDSGLSPESNVKRKPVMDIPLAVTKRDATGVHIFPGILRDSWKDSLSEMPDLKLDLYCLLRQRMEAEFELLKEQSDESRLRVRVSKVDDKPYIYLDNTGWVIEEAFLKNASEILALAENTSATASENVKDNPELVEFIARAVQTEAASQLGQMEDKAKKTPHTDSNASTRSKEGRKRKRKSPRVRFSEVLKRFTKGEFTSDDAYKVFPNTSKGTVRMRLHKAVREEHIKRKEPGV